MRILYVAVFVSGMVSFVFHGCSSTSQPSSSSRQENHTDKGTSKQQKVPDSLDVLEAGEFAGNQDVRIGVRLINRWEHKYARHGVNFHAVPSMKMINRAAKKGQSFVIVEIFLRFPDREPNEKYINQLTRDDFSLIDSKGNTYSPVHLFHDDNPPLSALKTFEHREGYLLFSVPDRAKGLNVICDLRRLPGDLGTVGWNLQSKHTPSEKE